MCPLAVDPDEAADPHHSTSCPPGIYLTEQSQGRLTLDLLRGEQAQEAGADHHPAHMVSRQDE